MAAARTPLPPPRRRDLPDPVGRRSVVVPAGDCYERQESTRAPQRIPRRIGDGFVTLDANWGTVQPMCVAPGVETIGELELIEHLRGGGLAVDTRIPASVTHGTIPGAIAIPSVEIAEHLAEFLRRAPVALFCNGPQCLATPRSIKALLDAGAPPEALLYYRGGLQDWLALGYRLAQADPTPWD